MLVDPHFLVKIMKGISRSIASKSLYIAFFSFTSHSNCSWLLITIMIGKFAQDRQCQQRSPVSTLSRVFIHWRYPDKQGMTKEWTQT